ncbi:MAG TPA: hydroxymethylbilane synthase [Tepidisphaeraceae bacterium]|nr:hydroxymethylbilane synthase [Tepidisphaeraceae bacterium]
MTKQSPTSVLRLGTRGSQLARTQSAMVAEQLSRRCPGLSVELVIYKTSGDIFKDRPLHEEGGKGLFTKELELALLAGEIDFAVHSLKDVPVTMPLVAQDNLVLAAIPLREDPRDVLVSSIAHRVMDLPAAARVGTGSLRRRCQLLAARPDLEIVPLRGNLDTRLRKSRDGEYDAIVAALAGLKRACLFDAATMAAIPTEEMLPAAGQGALALQCCRDDERTRGVLSLLHDPITARCVRAERAIVTGLKGDCHSPIGAFATIESEELTLRVAVGAPGGRLPVLTAAATAPARRWQAAVNQVLYELRSMDADDLMDHMAAAI